MPPVGYEHDTQPPTTMFLDTVFTPGLAHLSYVIGDAGAGVAAVIDPRRDGDVYARIARDHGVRISHVLETHIHADFVSGALEGADRLGAELCVSGIEAEYGFEARLLEDGEEIELGDVVLRTLHTPGHTPEHVSFVVRGGTGAEAPWGVFTGDTLFAGEVGRPDLLGEEEAERLARRLYHSLHEVLLPLGDGLQVLPAHGKGSPCGASIGDRTSSTIGYERAHNPRLQADDEDTFVREVLETAPEAPTYYPRMKRINARGPEPVGRLPDIGALDAGMLAERREDDDALVLDTREIVAWGGGHVPGSLNIALREAFPIWAGWLVEPDREVWLVTERPEDVATVRDHFLRIGLPAPRGWLADGFRGWTDAGREVRRSEPMPVHELRERIEDGDDSLQILDVRRDDEWEDGHLPGAHHRFLPHLRDGAPDDLDPDRTVAVYCGSGYRASMAVSLLEARGFADARVVPGSMSAWKGAEYPVVTPD